MKGAHVLQVQNYWLSNDIHEITAFDLFNLQSKKDKLIIRVLEFQLKISHCAQMQLNLLDGHCKSSMLLNQTVNWVPEKCAESSISESMTTIKCDEHTQFMIYFVYIDCYSYHNNKTSTH